LNGAIVDAREKLFEPALKEQIKTALNDATNSASHGASHDLSSRKYIKWDDPRVEKIPLERRTFLLSPSRSMPYKELNSACTDIAMVRLILICQKLLK
jgi:hypothetical protein